MKVVSKTSTGTVTKTVEYAYDHENRLVKREFTQGSTNTETFFAYDNSQIALTMDEDGDVQHRLLWAPAVDMALADDLVYEDNEYPDETYWHLTDHQGSVRDIVAYDPIGEEVVLASHHKYNAFGVRTGDLMSTLTIGYTGKYYDPDTGLQYHQYDGSDGRWLVVAIGRWLTPDPIGFEAGDSNLYRYVWNAVTIFVDPWGLQSGLPDDFIPDNPFGLPPYDPMGPRLPDPLPDPPPIKRPPGISLPDDDTGLLMERAPWPFGTIACWLNDARDQLDAHKKNKRKSTKDQHEQGERRREMDKPGREKGDKRRPKWK